MSITHAARRLGGRAHLAARVLPWRIRTAGSALTARSMRNARLVTLDVFDTALRRSVAIPVDVFWLAAWRLNQRHAAKLDIEATAQARIAAELHAREAARRQGLHEVTLAGIYAHMECPAEWRVALMAEELATERDVSFADPDILVLYRQLLARGMDVAFLSDTYLDRSVIAELLARAGYTGPHRLFVSNDFGVSKIEGHLFAAIVSATGVPAARICHIGDNPTADVAQARAAGWKALWYRPRMQAPPRLAQGITGADRVAASLIAGVAASLPGVPASSAADWQRIGHEVAGPVFLGFGQFVANSVITGRADNTAFCARDGRIIREVYERLRPCLPGLPPSNYLMVSRRALVFPMIERIGADELDFLTAQFARLQVAEFFARIGLHAADFTQAIGAAGLAPETVIDSPGRMAALRGLLQSLGDHIVQAAARERALLAAYVAQEGCLSVSRLALVDIGWQGSLQQAAGRLLAKLGADAALQGLYFGTYPSITRLAPEAGTARGWFVDAGAPPERYELTRTQWAVLELMFTAGHGSVLGYAERNGRVEAVLDAPATGEMPEYEQAALHIQQAALAMIDRFIAAFGGLPPVEIAPAMVAPRLARLALAPTLQEARSIGDLFHVDGLGATRTGQYIARPSGRLWPPAPRRLLRGYRGASWRRGYLVRALGGTRMALATIAAIRLIRPDFKSV